MNSINEYDEAIQHVMNALSKAREPSPAQPRVAEELQNQCYKYLEKVGQNRYVNVAFGMNLMNDIEY